MNFPVTTVKSLLSNIEPVTNCSVIHSTTGCAILSETGARLLGLFPAIDSFNTLWTPPDITEKLQKKTPNLGGERLWIAPQRNFFFKKPVEFENYHTQSSIDPGNYYQTGNLQFTSEVSIKDYIHDVSFCSCFSRNFEYITDPYSTNHPYMGVKITDSVSIDTPIINFCPWSISQVYAAGPASPGTAIIPFKKGGSFVEYFTRVPDNYAITQENSASFKIDSMKTYKIGLCPEDMVHSNPVKIAYMAPFPGGDRWFLVVKRSFDTPRTQQECVDVSSLDPKGRKGSTQIYNNFFIQGNRHDPFGEIELHFKSGKAGNSLTNSKGEHELLGYIGSKDDMLQLLGVMLGFDMGSFHLF